MERYVETRYGKARVNWYRNHRLGITYLEDDEHDHEVVHESKVCFKYGEIEPDEQKWDIRTASDVLKRLKALRILRDKERVKSMTEKEILELQKTLGEFQL